MTLKASNYPTVRPSLNFNFAQAERLDPRITFSRSSTGTYVDSTGIIRSAAANQARFGYNPETGESLGLLVEAAGTNYQLYSEDLTIRTANTSYGALNGSTVLTDQAVAPDLTVSADLVRENTGSSTHGLTINHLGLKSGEISGQTRTLSLFAKAKEVTQIGIIANFYGGTIFDLTSGTVLSSTGEHGIQKLANGWFRCWQVITNNYQQYNVRLADSGTTIYQGDGSSGLYIWGVQLDINSSYPTSYIPTTSSTATRAADVATVTNLNVYNTDSFTIINQPFGSSAGVSELTLFDGLEPIKRVSIYDQNLSQTTINAVAKKIDEFWRWRILGSSFALPNFATDGQVTVDWGDGTVETLTTSEHTFSNGSGYHDIGFRLDSGTYFRPYIVGNASHDTKVVAVGPAPVSMKLDADRVFSGCSNLEAFDATVDTSSSTSFYQAWTGCSSLTSFPLINTTAGTNFLQAWKNCSSLEIFPSIDMPSGTSFFSTWDACSSLETFPLIDMSSGTDFTATWRNCSSLDNIVNAGESTSFPSIDMPSGTDFRLAWVGCSSFTIFPLIDTSSGTRFIEAWRNCSSLTDFPAGFFDSWSPASVANQCFYRTWDGCNALTPTSVVNILNSIAASNQNAPNGTDTYDQHITIDWNGSGTPAATASAAITTLKNRGWDIYLNGIQQ